MKDSKYIHVTMLGEFTLYEANEPAKANNASKPKKTKGVPQHEANSNSEGPTEDEVASFENAVHNENSAGAFISANLTGRSRRLWILLAYLIANHERGVPSQELIDILWPEVTGMNPASKLQNNVSRARDMLEEAGFTDARNLIKYDNGVYRWAPDRKTIVDADILEAYARNFAKGIPQGDLGKAYAACRLYHGDYLVQASGESWCVNLRIYYKTLFTRLCRKTLHELLREGRIREVERLCLQVVNVDPAAEEFSVFLMQALIISGNPQKAIEHYDHIRQLLEKTYGVSASPQLELEHERALQKIYGRVMDEKAIRAFLEEPPDSGAFYCSTSVFRELVHLHIRTMRRSGLPSQLAVLAFDSSNMDQEQHAVNIKRLERVLSEALRSGDPFTKVGSEQLLVLLSGANFKDGNMVIDRVIGKFKSQYPQVDAELHSALYELTSFM